MLSPPLVGRLQQEAGKPGGEIDPRLRQATFDVSEPFAEGTQHAHRYPRVVRDESGEVGGREGADPGVLQGLHLVAGRLAGEEGMLAHHVARPGHPQQPLVTAGGGVGDLEPPLVHDEQRPRRLTRSVQQGAGPDVDGAGEGCDGVLLLRGQPREDRHLPDAGAVRLVVDDGQQSRHADILARVRSRDLTQVKDPPTLLLTEEPMILRPHHRSASSDAAALGGVG